LTILNLELLEAAPVEAPVEQATAEPEAVDPTADWQTFSSEAGNFSIRLPKTPVKAEELAVADAAIEPVDLNTAPAQAEVASQTADEVLAETGAAEVEAAAYDTDFPLPAVV
jgi:hypothetical protein